MRTRPHGVLPRPPVSWPRPLALVAIGAIVTAQAAVGAPATVVEHALRVEPDRRGQLVETQTWRVRIDDPAACSAGLIAPAGLSGASDGGARVLGELLVLPRDVSAGAEFTLTSARTWSGGASGVFTTAPDLPTERARVSITAPLSAPLTVWADPGGVPGYDRTRAARAAVVEWTDLPEDRGATFAWSTWGGWEEAGAAFEAAYDAHLADRATLGTTLAVNTGGLGVSGVVERVWAAVDVAPGDLGSLADARPAREVLAAGAGTAAERALVLVSALRVAGFDAHLAAARPGDSGVPLVVPAPALLSRTAVAARVADRVVWIDPASDHGQIGEIPAALRGAVAWVPGDLPRRVGDTGLHDGSVRVIGQANLDLDGDLAYDVTLQASGAATEWLRALLAPLDEAGRGEAIRRLLGQGRPELGGVRVQTAGVEDPSRPLRVSIQVEHPGALQPVGPGLQGSVPPLLAPALAGWLPPNVLVREEIAVLPASGLRPFAVLDEPPRRHADGVVSRAASSDPTVVRLVTEAVRPYRATSPAKDTAAAAFFREVAAAGPTVVLYPPLDPAGARRLQDEPAFADPAERDATELLLWLEAGDVRRARKVLRRAATTGLGPLVPHLVALSHPRDARALDLVWESTSEDLVRRDIARGLEALDATRTAWLAWAELVRAPDPEIRVEAFLAVRRLQPPAQPAALQDPIGNQSWFPPEHLLGWARDAAAQTDRGAADDPRLLRIDAIAAFEAGQDAEAEVRLARAQRVDDDPELAVWRARVAARTRVDTGETLEAVRAAVAAAPYDPDVLAAAAALLTEVEAHGLALEHAVAAARLAFDEAPRWLAVVDLALRVGDLTTATAAARRASDLDRADPALATTLAELARLAGDLDSATVAATRLGRAPPRGASEELDALLADLPADRLLAVLNHHDDAVRASPRALALRAQLRLELGALDEAAGDGLLLAERHGDPRGTAIAFSATAGRVWSSGLEEALDAHADNGQVGRTRLHWAVVTGARDPERVVGNVEDPHADAIRAWLRDADAAAATAPGWPSEGLPEPESAAPRGMRANRFLGLGTGVLGFSDPSTATSTLITARPIRGVPPPLSLLATPHEPAVRTMAGGGRIVRLDGLEMPVYAAFKVRGELGVTGIGFTPDAAERAARAALGEE